MDSAFSFERLIGGVALSGKMRLHGVRLAENTAPCMSFLTSEFPQDTHSKDSWQKMRLSLEAELGERVTLNALTGPTGLCGRGASVDDTGATAGWLIAQRKMGHRHSIDDVLTAWYALRISPQVSHHLDLGTGIGSVGLLTLWGMGQDAQLTCVEAQEISYRLLQANILVNGLAQRVHCSHGDLRELALSQKFPLVTGSPPYFPPGSGVIPQDSQKAHARFELRGNVSDYAKAAVAHLAPGGWFVLCFPTPQDQRVQDGMTAAGLKVVFQKNVIPRETLPPLFTLYACQLAVDFPSEGTVEEPFVVRHVCGKLTEEMKAVRRGFGFLDRELLAGEADDSTALMK